MTFQKRERITHQNKTYFFSQEPLSQFFDITEKNLRFVKPNTNCWRRYYGTWEIKNNGLYLIEFEAYLQGFKEIDIEYLFPGKSIVFADWFTGKITISCGEDYEETFSGNTHIFKSPIDFYFQNGLLQSITPSIFEPTPPKKSCLKKLADVFKQLNKNY